MPRSEEERVVEQLAERLRSTETLMVADYRGLTMPEIDELRPRLPEAGGRITPATNPHTKTATREAARAGLREGDARCTVVKTARTRRAAEEAGTTEVLELIDGPTAIAFLEADGGPGGGGGGLGAGGGAGAGGARPG